MPSVCCPSRKRLSERNLTRATPYRQTERFAILGPHGEEKIINRSHAWSRANVLRAKARCEPQKSHRPDWRRGQTRCTDRLPARAFSFTVLLPERRHRKLPAGGNHSGTNDRSTQQGRASKEGRD